MFYYVIILTWKTKRLKYLKITGPDSYNASCTNLWFKNDMLVIFSCLIMDFHVKSYKECETFVSLLYYTSLL